MSRSQQVGRRLAPTGTSHDFSRRDRGHDEEENPDDEENPEKTSSGGRGDAQRRRLRS